MIIVDVETSSVNRGKGSILSIGALEFEDPYNQFKTDCRIFPGAEVNQEALDVNGFTLEEITDEKKPSVGEAISEFLKWTGNIEDRTLAGFNVDFDRDYIRNNAELFNLKWTLGRRIVDLHGLCFTDYLYQFGKAPLKSNKDQNFRTSNVFSDQVMEYVGLPLEPKPHRAFNGVLWETEAFGRLIYGIPYLRSIEDGITLEDVNGYDYVLFPKELLNAEVPSYITKKFFR